MPQTKWLPIEQLQARIEAQGYKVQKAKLKNACGELYTIDKTGKVSAGLSAVPFLPSSAFSRAKATGDSSNTFEGKGSTENTNDFSGVITASVTGVLPNGHLLISGEKQIGVNDNVDVLRFSGQVDPRSIQPGNSVASAQIANVRLEHKGRGAQADARVIGWLARFFLSVLPI